MILSCVYGPMGGADNGRYGNRLPYFFGGDYANASWGIPDFCWEYPTKSSARVCYTNDFVFDIYVNKQADSRYQKSFHVEYLTALDTRLKITWWSRLWSPEIIADSPVTMQVSFFFASSGSKAVFTA